MRNYILAFFIMAGLMQEQTIFACENISLLADITQSISVPPATLVTHPNSTEFFMQGLVDWLASPESRQNMPWIVVGYAVGVFVFMDGARLAKIALRKAGLVAPPPPAWEPHAVATTQRPSET